jgi:nitroimidazol reductase NimA-like FMN-containing flavoprotein (pyridoxamine 5'-phosphate oxidase superfamily)
MTAEHPFDIDAFLDRPMLARVAAAGPSVRPVWFLWEDGAFWWITGAYARLPTILTSDPRVALVVDSCDLCTGEVRQVTARGDAVVVPFDAERVRRKLVRYLGPNEDDWDPRFSGRYLSDPDQATRLVRLAPTRLTATDLSFSVDGGGVSR